MSWSESDHTGERRAEVMAYVTTAKNRSERERHGRGEEGERCVHRILCKASVHGSRCAGLGG
jgi:hypothetical protein